MKDASSKGILSHIICSGHNYSHTIVAYLYRQKVRVGVIIGISVQVIKKARIRVRVGVKLTVLAFITGTNVIEPNKHQSLLQL